jgi:hypothetical protein
MVKIFQMDKGGKDGEDPARQAGLFTRFWPIGQVTFFL